MKKSLLFCSFLALILISACSRTQPEAAPMPEPTADPGESFEAGLLLMRGNDFSGAEDYFARAIEADPEFGLAYSGLALTRIWGGWRDAETTLNAERGVELAPGEAFAWAVLGYARLNQRLLMDAVAKAEHAHQLNADDPFIQMVLAITLTGNYEYERAWEILATSYAQNPDSPEILVALGTYYSATDDFNRAMAAFDRTVELDPDFAPWQIAQAQFYLSTNRYPQAVPVLDGLLEDYPDYLPALVGQIQLEIQKADFEAAEQRIDRLEMLAPRSFYSNYLRGRLTFAQADYSAALAFFTAARELDPDQFMLHFSIGEVYLQQGDCGPASEIFSELADTYPDDVLPLVGRGYARICAGDTAGAQADFLDALWRDSYSEQASFGLAQTYLLQGETRSAENVLFSALSLERSAASAHLALSKMFLFQGEAEAAEEEARLAIEHDPYSIEGYNLLATVLLSDFNVEAAMEAVDQALDINPYHPAALRLKAVLLYFSDSPAESLSFIEQAVQAAPQYTALHLFKGLALRDQGEFAQAAESISAYISLMQEEGVGDAELASAVTLLQALDEGYTLSQKEGIDLIRSDLGELLRVVPSMRIADRQDGQTLVISLPITTNQFQSESYLYDLRMIASSAGFYLPRMAPQVDNGLVIEVSVSGQAMHVASLSFSDLQGYSDSLIGLEDFLESIAFDLAESTVQRATIEQIIRDVAQLRDAEYDEVPPFEIISETTVGINLLENFDAEYMEELDAEISSLAMLGAIDSGVELVDIMVEYLTGSVAGYYSTEEEKIYVVSSSTLTSYDQLTLAHECEHAIMDQIFNLNSVRSRTNDSDRYQAVTALVEGDATLVMRLYLYEFIPDLGWYAPPTSDEDGSDAADQSEVPAYFTSMSAFPYVYGLDFVSYLYELGGWQRINSAMWDPPISTEQVMHPEKFIDGEEPQRIYLDDPSDVLGADWSIVDADVLGEYGAYLTLSRFIGSFAAASAAEGWGGDRYILLENADDDQVFVWRTGWDNTEEADEFWQALITAMFHRTKYREIVEDFTAESSTRTWHSRDGYYVIHRDGDLITILVGDDLETLELLVDVLD